MSTLSSGTLSLGRNIDVNQIIKMYTSCDLSGIYLTSWPVAN